MGAGDITIRDFRRSDFLKLWEIDQQCFPPGISYSQRELLYYIGRPRAFTLVGERQTGETVGFLVAESGRRTGHVITIDVVADARRSGLGSRLMAMAEERMRSEGCVAVVLETAVDNAEAMAFYRRHRYFLVKTIPRYYATGVDAFVLKKDLVAAREGESGC
jgi:[ribosomal protein S18]-alanine N-acetyltransferase